MAGSVGAIARSRRLGVLTCITTSCRTNRLSPYARLWLISTVKHPGGGCCAAAAVEHPRARAIRRATSPRPQGTRIGHQTSRVDLLASPVHRRQSRVQRQSVEPNPVGSEERVGRNIKCLYAALEGLKRGRDILRTPNVAPDDLKGRVGPRLLEPLAGPAWRGVTAINHYRQPA